MDNLYYDHMFIQVCKLNVTDFKILIVIFLLDLLYTALCCMFLSCSSYLPFVVQMRLFRSWRVLVRLNDVETVAGETALTALIVTKRTRVPLLAILQNRSFWSNQSLLSPTRAEVEELTKTDSACESVRKQADAE